MEYVIIYYEWLLPLSVLTPYPLLSLTNWFPVDDYVSVWLFTSRLFFLCLFTVLNLSFSWFYLNYISNSLFQRMFKSKLNMRDCIFCYFFVISSKMMYWILIYHLDIYRDFIHAKPPMEKSVLFSPTINKYTTNDLTLGNLRDYFFLYWKDLPEVVK